MLLFAPVLALSLTCFAPTLREGGTLTSATRRPAVHLQLSAPDKSAVDLDDDADFDELVRQEVQAAFAGLEESLSSGDDEKALEQIRTQGKTVLANVLKRMEDEGQLLSATLSTQLEELASEQTSALLERYEEGIAAQQAEVAAELLKLRAEMENLEALNKEYQDLVKGGGGMSSKDKIISAIALIAGVTYLGAAITESLKIVLDSGGDPLTAGLNGALGVVGVGYHFQRESKSKA